MESFERHLGGRLTYTLGGEGADRLTGFDDASVDFFDVNAEEKFELQISYTVECVFDVLFVAFVCDFYAIVIFLEVD